MPWLVSGSSFPGVDLTLTFCHRHQMQPHTTTPPEGKVQRAALLLVIEGFVFGHSFQIGLRITVQYQFGISRRIIVDQVIQCNRKTSPRIDKAPGAVWHPVEF